jgi:hypothetical protein
VHHDQYHDNGHSRDHDHRVRPDIVVAVDACANHHDHDVADDIVGSDHDNPLKGMST